MTFDEYEEKAKETDQFADDPKRSIEVALRNISQESISLQQLSKDIHKAEGNEFLVSELEKQFKTKAGDVLWYLTNLCRHSGVSLRDVAASNVDSINSQYGKKKKVDEVEYKAGSCHIEQLPEELEVAFIPKAGKMIIAVKLANGEALQLGDRINDNSHEPDFYRFHDVFHLSYVAFLGWSPVIRALLKRKRKNNPLVDEIEDGARAANLEEALTAFIFEQAKRNNYFADYTKVDFEILQTIDRLVGGLEVSQCDYQSWEKAILEGYKVFNELREHKKGVVSVNSKTHSLKYISVADSEPCFQKLFKGSEETASGILATTKNITDSAEDLAKDEQEAKGS